MRTIQVAASTPTIAVTAITTRCTTSRSATTASRAITATAAAPTKNAIDSRTVVSPERLVVSGNVTDAVLQHGVELAAGTGGEDRAARGHEGRSREDVVATDPPSGTHGHRHRADRDEGDRDQRQVDEERMSGEVEKALHVGSRCQPMRTGSV